MMNSQLTVYFLLALSIALASVDCNSEGDILYTWKTKLVDPYNVLQSWNPNLVNPCTWFHVTCDVDNSVVRLDLGAAGLAGPLIPELANLTNLQYLELYANHINETIPREFGKLRRLVSFDLYQNHLSGTIPKSFGHLNSLRFLRVSQNNLGGAIPASLGNLTSLEILALNSNKFTGSFPITVLSLILRGNLRTLDFSDNLLAGTIRRGNSTVTTIIQDPKAPKH